MTLRPYKRPMLADDVLRAHCELAKRIIAGQPLDDATLVAIGHRFDVDAGALAADMLLRRAFAARVAREMN